ncbi:hypothetical protein LCM19_02155 [Qipengyuania flava]|nr:hypothetical protein [Qipengyuania flava]
MREELPLHDATIDGIVVKDKVATLYFIATDGRGCEVRLSGIDALHMDDFQQGNIVVLFETTNGEHSRTTVDLERLYGSPHPSAAKEYHEKSEALLARKHRAIATGELTLIEMQPAIGADLLATCERVELKYHGYGS